MSLELRCSSCDNVLAFAVDGTVMGYGRFVRAARIEIKCRHCKRINRIALLPPENISLDMAYNAVDDTP